MIFPIAVLILVVVTTAADQNCSTYNPCGKYGYCESDPDNGWVCACKFWWDGTYCTEQTSSGIQVITLGIMLFILVIIFYALSIACSIRQKREQAKLENIVNKPDATTTPKLTSLVSVKVKKSARISTCCTMVLMLIVTIVSLVVEQTLLQPIHNDSVNKYKAGLPVYYNASSLCSLTNYDGYNMLTFPVACFVVLVFIIFSKRVSCMKDCWRSFIAPVVPMDFYIHTKRMLAAAIFAVIASELLGVISDFFNGYAPKADGVILTYLLRLAVVAVIGVRYYPLLAAAYVESILTLSFATLYAWLDFSVSIVSGALCLSPFYQTYDNYEDSNDTDIVRNFGYYGTGQNLIIIQVITDIPERICWAYIVVKLPMLLIAKIRSTIKHRNDDQLSRMRLTREEKIFLHSSVPYSVEMSYVRNLFRPVKSRSSDRILLARLIPTCMYQWRDDFRFSTRIICIYASVLFMLYYMTIQTCIMFIPTLALRQKDLTDLIKLISLVKDGGNDFPVPNLIRPFVFAIMTAYIIMMLQVIVLLVNIRRNLLQIFRGDDSEIPKRDSDRFMSYGTGNFHFAGFFIGFLVWGYVLVAILALVLYVCIDSFITFGSVRYLEILLKKIIPILLLMFFKQYLNKLLARYVFLQRYGQILAIDNRRFLMIFIYFNFFLDALLGFISAIIRIILSVLGGCIYMCRLDYSPLGRKLETLDSGFSAYCGFIHMEAVHRNPVLTAFASFLYSRMKAKKYTTESPVPMISNRMIQKKRDYTSKAARRWYLAVLLSQNPSLIGLRKNALLQKMNEDEETQIQNEKKRRASLIAEGAYRPSLISETDLHHIWQSKR